MQSVEVEIEIWDRRAAPPALLAKCTAAWIARVAPSVSLSERAELRSRGIAVFDREQTAGAAAFGALFIQRGAQA